ncbi:ZIP family metal transporter [Marixanthomonas sp. SCSIO 43207]|uniref:ZIP family metal transporter n=1 Tax=Marixanthomonas sp. SCSIO 43207 TaxID=2779360 RepID=UPI001CA8B679|nr:ZIP family metal transporter [Marixanthomonas sp. SCSIO 43207]UAB80877.1 ZIP family metal transporter [Marixanthomonas sp. SCSIO 43207]
MNYVLLFLAVVVGFIIASSLKTKKIQQISLYLAFSGAFLLAITVFELLPEVFETPSKSIGVFIMIGILLQIFLEFFSKGAEHGHVHIKENKQGFPWLLFISLSIHALMEGFPITEENNLLIGIIVHKIPVAVILSFFFIKAGFKKHITLIFLFLFALMTPLGNFIANNFKFLEEVHTQITAIVIGIFLHVSTTILFESSSNHKFNLSKIVAVLIGIFVAYLL